MVSSRDYTLYLSMMSKRARLIKESESKYITDNERDILILRIEGLSEGIEFYQSIFEEEN